eukprot:INCI3316.1.p1 GENE.INCI3316.1~~INCI3316.1.p1  ORF type:complete len:1663 (+),score=305.23 INCI3316.1:955-5943(+)
MPLEPPTSKLPQQQLRRNSKSRSQMPVADLCQRALGEMSKRAQRLPTDGAHVETLVLRAVHNRGIFADYFDADVQSFVAALAAQATLFHVQPKLTKSFSIAYHKHGIGNQVFIMLAGCGVSAVIRTDEAVTQRFPQPGDSFGLHMSMVRNAQESVASEAAFPAEISDLDENSVSDRVASIRHGSQTPFTDRGLDCEIKVTAPPDAEAVFLCIPSTVFVPQFALLLRDVVSRSNLQRTLNVLRHVFHGHISDGAAAVVANTLSRYMAKWSFCKDKSREEVEMMAYICARDARLVRVPAGETLFRQGDEIDPERAFFVVLRGRAEVWLEQQEDEAALSDDDTSVDSCGFRSGSDFDSPDKGERAGESSLTNAHPVANTVEFSTPIARSTSLIGKPKSAPSTALLKPHNFDDDNNVKMCATMLEVGASFGEIALIESGKRTATVVATAPKSNDDAAGAATKSFANGEPEPRPQPMATSLDGEADNDCAKVPDRLEEFARAGDKVKDADEATAATKQLFRGDDVLAGEDGPGDDTALYLFAVSSAAYAAAIEVAQNEAVQEELAMQRSLSAFRGFSNTQHFEWRHYFRAETVRRNHILFEQGAPSTMVKFIISGSCVARYRDPAAIAKAEADAAAQAAKVAEEAAALARARAAEEEVLKKMSRSRRRRRLRRNKKKLKAQQQGASVASASELKSLTAATIAGDWRPMFYFGPGDAVGDIAFCRNVNQPFRVQVTSETAVVWTLHDSLLIRERLRAPLENLRLSAMTLEHCFLLSLPPAERLPGQVDFLATTLTQPYLGRLSACAAMFVDECREDRALQTRIVNALLLRKVRRGTVLAVQDQSTQLLAIVISGTATVHKKVRRDLVSQSPRRSRRPKQVASRRFFDTGAISERNLETFSRSQPLEDKIESSAVFLTDVPLESPSLRADDARLANDSNRGAMACAGKTPTEAPTRLDGGSALPVKGVPLPGNQMVDLAQREVKFGDTVRHLDSGDMFGTEALQLLRHKNALPHHSSTVVAESSECWIATIEPRALAEILDDCTNAPQRRKFRFFRNVSALAHLPDHAIGMLAECSEETFWSKGDVILDCGARNTTTLFFIAQGECEVFGRLVSDNASRTATGSTALLQRQSGSRNPGQESSDNGISGQNLKRNATGMMSRQSTGAFPGSGNSGSSGFRSRAGSTAAGSSALPAVSLSEGHSEAGARALQTLVAKTKLTEREVVPARANPDARIVDAGVLRGAFGVPDLLQQPQQSPTMGSHAAVAGAIKGEAATTAARVQSVQLQASHFTKQWQKYANMQQGDCFGAAVFFALRKHQQHRIVASGWTDLDAHGRSESGELSPRRGSSPQRHGAGTHQNERELDGSTAFGHHPVRLYELRLPTKKSAAEHIIKLLRPLRTISAQRLAWRDQQRERINSLARSMLQQGPVNSASPASHSVATEGAVTRKLAQTSLHATRESRPRRGNRMPRARSRQRGHGILVDAVPLRAGNNRGAAITAPWLSDASAPGVHKRASSTSLENTPQARSQSTSRHVQSNMKAGGTRQVVEEPGARSLRRLQSPQNRVALRPRVGAALAKAVGHDDVATSHGTTETSSSAEIVAAAARSAQALIGVVPQTQATHSGNRSKGSKRGTNQEDLLPDERDIQRVLALPEIKRSLKQVNWKYRNQW